ncbi:unnamed protein product [Lathyrus sativus]|nr:unnamed protein product [Lathyrus sativus]
MASVKFDFEAGNDGVVVITMCTPPVNALALPIIRTLKYKFDEATKKNDAKDIVLTGKGGRFSRGFDISVMQKVHQTGNITFVPDVSVELVVNSIEDSKNPIVAALAGRAV